MLSHKPMRLVVIVIMIVTLLFVAVGPAYASSLLGQSQLNAWCKVQLSRSDAYAVFHNNWLDGYGWHCYGPNSPPGTQWVWLNATGACQYYGSPSAIGWNANGVYCN